MGCYLCLRPFLAVILQPQFLFFPLILRSYLHRWVPPTSQLKSQQKHVRLKLPQRSLARREPTGTRAPPRISRSRDGRPNTSTRPLGGRGHGPPGPLRSTGRSAEEDCGERAGRAARRVRDRGKGEAHGAHLGAQVSPGQEAASRRAALGLARAPCPASRAWGVCLENGGYEGRRSPALTSSRLGSGRRHLEEFSFKLARSEGIVHPAGRPAPDRPAPEWGARAGGLESARRADVTAVRPQPLRRARLRPTSHSRCVEGVRPAEGGIHG